MAESLSLPAVTVSGHQEVLGITNIILDHNRAACLAFEHLQKLGHSRIAMIKGQDFSSDTEIRWRAFHAAAKQFGLVIPESLSIQLDGYSPSPELGYTATKKLLDRGQPFTALFAFNDISAIGAIQALRQADKRVPEGVSVMGFDDIQSAEYQNPGLTTVRQPLRRMGVVAAETLLRRVSAGRRRPAAKEVVLQPELIIRGTTAPAR
jgi:DNA-binding LacI/PurR family transcriptional regulator